MELNSIGRCGLACSGAGEAEASGDAAVLVGVSVGNTGVGTPANLHDVHIGGIKNPGVSDVPGDFLCGLSDAT